MIDRLLEHLSPDMIVVFLPAFITALIVGVTCALVSVIAVLKRLAFAGQGISHAAFGGIGIAYAIGFTGSEASGGSWWPIVIVVLFCLAAAALIARLSERAAAKADTAIGIVLVTTMAAGFLLFRVASARATAAGQPSPPAIEGVLFGSIIMTDWSDAITAGIVGVMLVALLFVVRRPLLFWAFDEPVAAALGVHVGRMNTLLMVVLAALIVVAMKFAGVVLASALLILPGAAALRLSDRMGTVILIACAMSLVGVLVGFVATLAADLEAGPAIVIVLAAEYFLAHLVAKVRSG